jgi:uncharacterized membrane protein (DUF106 family)
MTRRRNMRKVLVLAFAMVFVLSLGVFAHEGDEGMQGGMMWSKADVKVENTADGVRIMVTSKNAKEVKEIQEGTVKMIEMREKMMKEPGEGKEGMWGHGMGMGMMNPEMMQHMQKKVGIAFKFLMAIWSLLIILIAATIVLVIKKIMAKTK